VAAFKLPQARFALPGATPLTPTIAPLDLPLPLPQAARLSQPPPARLEGLPVGPQIAGQLARLVRSLPFPDAGALHVGHDLGHALQAFLAAPVAPALPLAPLRELPLQLPAQDLVSHLPAAAATPSQGEWVPTLPGVSEPWTPTLPGVSEPWVPTLPGLPSPAPALADLPPLLIRALRRDGDWVAGPGAPLPTAVREHALELEEEYELAHHRRRLNPGEEEIVVPQPLWVRMERRAAPELELPLPVWSTPSVFDDIVRERSIDLPLPPPRTADLAEELLPLGRTTVVHERQAPAPHRPAPPDLPLPLPTRIIVREEEEIAAEPREDGLPIETVVAFHSARTREGLSPSVPIRPSVAGEAPREILEGDGDDALGLSRTVRVPPPALRFRYPGAPLWWSSATPSAERSFTPVVEAFEGWRSPIASMVEIGPGERRPNTSAALWRSIFVLTPEAARSVAESLEGAADAESGLSRHVDAPEARLPGIGVALPGVILPAVAQHAREAVPGPVYVAMSGQGLLGLTGSAAARAKAEAVEMDIVAAVPPPPPPIESMGGSEVDATGTRSQGAPAATKAESEGTGTDSVSTSKLEGSVDAIAQRIYHRIRRRMESDRERFGG
jgi:hypothetical protein